jgi:hypothetical protein
MCNTLHLFSDFAARSAPFAAAWHLLFRPVDSPQFANPVSEVSEVSDYPSASRARGLF